MPVVMIAVPAVGILVALVMRGGGGEQVAEDHVEEVVEDPNREINDLKAKLPPIEKEGYAVMRGLRQDPTPEVRKRAKILLDRMDEWMIEWDGLLDEHRDDNGELHEDYQGYAVYRSTINQLRVDLMRMSSF